MTKPTPPRSVTAWLQCLQSPNPKFLETLQATYGDAHSEYTHESFPLSKALNTYLEAYGDEDVQIFRAPGRVNLRGMHVDTHGGYQNLMAHQSEVVLVARPDAPGTLRLVNADPHHDPIDTQTDFYTNLDAFQLDWESFITHSTVEAERIKSPGHWLHYPLGALLCTQHNAPGETLQGLRGAIASTVPQGAALSSSAALCVVMVLACHTLNNKTLSNAELILRGRDAEWFSGARTGTADQTAVVMSRPGQLVHGPLFAEAFTTDTLAYTPFPEALRLLVIQSQTTRQLSGKALVAYTTNRFAYSMAMAILAQVCDQLGIQHRDGLPLNRLAHLSPHLLGGESELYRALREIPVALPLDTIRTQYDIPNLEANYQLYFGGAPEADRPTEIPLRGPLLFGIAESERGRIFADLLNQSKYTEAGALMTAGHNGDRILNPDGSPYEVSLDLDDSIAIPHIPGAYGASSPALDALVDAALEAGALGASLTGAGIAGTVLALCKVEDAETIMEQVRRCLASEAYAQRAGFSETLDATTVANSVAIHRAISGAGML